MPNTMFPIFLKMDQIQTLVVGGGNVALEKASAILRNSPEAKLTLVAPFFRPETLEYLQDFPHVHILARGFQPSDLQGLDLIICATDSPVLHAEIKALAAAAHQAWSANIYSIATDMFPKKAVSSVIGIGGMAGSVGGIFFPMIVGSLLDKYKLLGNINDGYNIIFLLCGSAYMIAWVIIYTLVPTLETAKIDD